MLKAPSLSVFDGTVVLKVMLSDGTLCLDKLLRSRCFCEIVYGDVW